MISRLRTSAWAILASLVLDASATELASAGPVYVEILADQNRTSPDPLAPFDIRFIVYANGNKIQGIVFAGVFEFSTHNIIGTIDEYPAGEAQVTYASKAVSTFQSIAWSSVYGNGSDPDSLLLGMTSFFAPWTGSGEMFRIHVTPKDTGSFYFDSVWYRVIPGPGKISAMDPSATALPLEVIQSVIHVPPIPDPVRFRIATSSGSDTLFMGVPGTIYFTVDAMGNAIAGQTFAFQWDFSNGNFIGPFSDLTGEVKYSPVAEATYESIGFDPGNSPGSDPDTSVLGMSDFGGGPFFSGSDWMWSVTFDPLDTGTVEIDTLGPPSSASLDAFDTLGSDLPFSFIPGRIVVLPCPYTMMGDVNQDAVMSSADLIYFINYIFKSGPDPLPERSVGDVNCSGGLGGADIIHMVNYIFKSGAAPCACIVRRI